jgi:ABC-type Na+ transport system ATPase subunit NatA
VNQDQRPGSSGAKRPVNLTLSVGVVEQASALTNNLSATVEVLLVEYVARMELERGTREQRINELCDRWNHLNEQHGSYADEFSPL